MARRVSERVCRGLVRAFQQTPLCRVAMRNEQTRRFSSYDAYIEDRMAQVAEYQRLFRPFVSFSDKAVAELGCSQGYILDAFRREEPFTAIGIDRDPQVLRLGAKDYPSIRFVQSTATTIPLDTASVDIVYTIDTVEHLSHVHEIFLECHRIMRVGGIFLIHFHPWLGPYGSHLEDVIPLPWPHLLFSMETLLATAADVYDSDGYVPVCYWFDRETGDRKPNPYRDVARWREYLNRVTVRQFRRVLSGTPFVIQHFETIGFGGRRFPLARRLRWLAQLRGPDEFFTKAVFCVLVKP